MNKILVLTTLLIANFATADQTPLGGTVILEENNKEPESSIKISAYCLSDASIGICQNVSIAIEKPNYDFESGRAVIDGSEVETIVIDHLATDILDYVKNKGEDFLNYRAGSELDYNKSMTFASPINIPFGILMMPVALVADGVHYAAFVSKKSQMNDTMEFLLDGSQVGKIKVYGPGNITEDSFYALKSVLRGLSEVPNVSGNQVISSNKSPDATLSNEKVVPIRNVPCDHSGPSGSSTTGGVGYDSQSGLSRARAAWECESLH